MNIYIDRWAAWQPRTGKPALSHAFRNGRNSEAYIDKPKLGNVPAMARRRLGSLARVVFHVLGQCADISRQEPVIFSSLMGEIKRTQGILNDLAEDKPVSPTAFSLSVHNAISGQWALIHGIRAPMGALSPSGGSCVGALVEAAGIIHEGKYHTVNVVFYEEDHPAFYAPFFESPVAATALALRVVTKEQANEDSLRLSLNRVGPTSCAVQAKGPLDLIPLLNKSTSSLIIAEPQCHWQLEHSE